MGIRGRKTNAEKAARSRALEEMGLPPPPTHLSEAAQLEWSQIVETYPLDRFPRGTWPMLELYCVHTVQSRRIMGLLDTMSDETSISDYNRLLGMLDRESRTVAQFGVRLGIARTTHAGRHNNDPETLAERDLPWKD